MSGRFQFKKGTFELAPRYLVISLVAVASRRPAIPLIFDHVILGVADIAAARRFYDRVLTTLGITLQWETAEGLCYGDGGDLDFGVSADTGKARRGTHVCFRAEDRDSVDRFHAEGVSAGGRDGGAPGLRPEYHPGYYAAYLEDPDGNRIEAVCHGPA